MENRDLFADPALRAAQAALEAARLELMLAPEAVAFVEAREDKARVLRRLALAAYAKAVDAEKTLRLVEAPAREQIEGAHRAWSDAESLLEHACWAGDFDEFWAQVDPDHPAAERPRKTLAVLSSIAYRKLNEKEGAGAAEE